MVLWRDRYFWIVIFVSISVRIYLSFFTYVIQNDSVAFMRNAGYFANGDFANALKHPYHPLYALLMAGLNTIVPNMELSGTIVSVVFGTLTVIAFYLIGKRIFNQEIAFVSSIILAFHPYAVRFSADIISESTYFLFFISSLGFGYFAITMRKYLLFALAGACTAFAYLTRPEGIGIILIIIFWCILKDITKFKIFWKEKLVSILIMGIAFLMLSFPYILFIKCETGVWLLTMKRNLSNEKIVMAPDGPSKGKLIKENTDRPKYLDADKKKQKVVNKTSLSTISEKSVLEKPTIIKEKLEDSKSTKKEIPKLSGKTYLKSFMYITNKYLSTLHPFLFVFFIIGVISWKKTGKDRFFGLYLLTIIVFYLLILLRLNLVNIANSGTIYQYPSRRHLMPIIIPAIFCVGIGVYAIGTWTYKRLQVYSLKVYILRQLKSKWIVQLAVLIIVVGVLMPKTLKHQGVDKIGIKNVAQWIKQNSDKQSPVIMSSSIRNAYYADGRHMQMHNIDEVFSIAEKKCADYILITQRDYEMVESKLQQSIKNNQIELVYKYPETSLNGRTILLYKLIY